MKIQDEDYHCSEWKSGRERQISTEDWATEKTLDRSKAAKDTEEQDEMGTDLERPSYTGRPRTRSPLERRVGNRMYIEQGRHL